MDQENVKNRKPLGPRPRFLEALVAEGLLTQEQAKQVQQLQEEQHLRLDEAILQLGYLEERQLLQAFARHFGMAYQELDSVQVDREVLRMLPPKIVYRRRLFPIGRENGALRVATADPWDLSPIEEARLLTGFHIEPVLAPREDIERLIKLYYGVGGDTIQEMVGEQRVEVESTETSKDLLEMAQEASVIKLVNEIIIEAVQQRASDIHIEPYENRLSIRYRIDGVLHEASVPPEIHRFQAAIVSRIKILANLNIAEKRVPQDGRIEFAVGGREIDVRVSVIPMLFGEGVVLRLLDKRNVLFTLPELGMEEDTFATFNQLIRRPHGIILVTGPTGAGKTTTLYAALNAIVSPRIKVLTVEDPVEYYLPGVNQIPVDPKVGMTFERGLRAILRHDPDVIMIGEIRDLETARAAIQAALTGHLVLSTLHTNDACSAPIRLIDMGIEPYLVSSTLIGAMAQRLVRRICSECKETYVPDPATLPDDFQLQEGEVLWHGQGCERCHHTGYYGRTGIFELMTMNHEIAELVQHRRPTHEVVKAARRSGLRLLREDGWVKVRRGITTIEEVLACTAV